MSAGEKGVLGERLLRELRKLVKAIEEGATAPKKIEVKKYSSCKEVI